MIAVLMATPSVTFTVRPLIVPERVFLMPIPPSCAISKPLLLVKKIMSPHFQSEGRQP